MDDMLLIIKLCLSLSGMSALPTFHYSYIVSLFSDLGLWSPLCEPPNLFTTSFVVLPVFVFLALFGILLPQASSPVWHNSLLSGVTLWLNINCDVCLPLVCLYLDDETHPHVGMANGSSVHLEQHPISELGIQGPWDSNLPLHKHTLSVLLGIHTTARHILPLLKFPRWFSFFDAFGPE